MFDVVVPLFNKKNNIADLIEHLLDVSEIANEIFIIDDCSTDDSFYHIEEMLRNVKVDNISLHRLEENSGPQIARSFGAEMSNSDWVLFMDADDFVCIEGLKMIQNNMPNVSDDIVLINGIRVSVNCKFKLDEIVNLNLDIKAHHGRVVSKATAFFKEPLPAMSGFLLRKKYANEMSLVKASWGEDIIFFLNLITHSNFMQFDIPISIYRLDVPGARGSQGGTFKKRLSFLNELLNINNNYNYSFGDVLFRMYYTSRVLAAWFYKKIK